MVRTLSKGCLSVLPAFRCFNRNAGAGGKGRVCSGCPPHRLPPQSRRRTGGTGWVHRPASEMGTPYTCLPHSSSRVRPAFARGRDSSARGRTASAHLQRAFECLCGASVRARVVFVRARSAFAHLRGVSARGRCAFARGRGASPRLWGVFPRLYRAFARCRRSRTWLRIVWTLMKHAESCRNVILSLSHVRHARLHESSYLCNHASMVLHVFAWPPPTPHRGATMRVDRRAVPPGQGGHVHV